jgi:hypothetical protein
MIGQCKYCARVCEKDFCLIQNRPDDFGCTKFEPSELLVESEIVEWMQFIKHQERKTTEAILKGKRKYIKHDDNCILVEEENCDSYVIPISDDYLDYATDMLDEFIEEADFNDLAIGDKITFTFIRMSDKKYEELCNNDA